MADITVSNDVDALMRSADNEAIRTSIGVPTPEEIMNPLVEGQGLLNSFVGSAAAYSLRDLNKTNPDVVEVRRGSDETSRIFKANEIGSTLENWVNAEVALPLDTASGAAAAYSLRDLSVSRADLTSIGDTLTQTDYFTLTGATGSSVIFNGALFNINGVLNSHSVFVLSTDSDVFFYWDSGSYKLRDNSTGATVSYATALDDTTYPWEADWTGTELSAATLDRNTTGALVAQVRRSSDDEIKSFTAAEVAGSTMVDWVNTDMVLANGVFINNPTPSNVYETFSSSSASGFTALNSTGLGHAFSDIGVQPQGVTFTVTYDVSITSGSPNMYLATQASSLGGYQASDTTQISTTSGSKTFTFTTTRNDGRYLTISEGDSPSEFTVSNVVITQTTAHGHVTKWYDQSGNDNHAVQATPASQPKVVEGGVLLAEGLKFDGGQMLDIPTSWDIGNLSSFLAAAVPIVGGNNVVLDLGNQAQNLRWIAPWDNVGTRRFGYADNGSVIAISASSNTTLYTAIAGSTAGGLNGFANGVLQGTASLVSGTPSGTQRIGARYDGGYPFTGTIPELIIYDSDQSDNRKAIESNMADYHGNIDLPAGFDSGNNEVDGYVAMWYDQSGNGNNAVQAVATSQPKIVEGGDLVADGLKFDGNGQSLELPTAAALGINGTNPKSFFSKATITASEQLIILGSNASTGAAIRLRAQAQGLTRIEVQGGGIDGGSALGSNGAVISSIFNGTQLADFDISSNGVITNSTSTLAINTADTSLHIGYLGGGLSEGLGQVEELIIYDSDQSLVRKSIEFNINNAYSIY